jgi:hypothetical protein
MWPANYFGPRYFAPRYWCKVGADVTGIFDRRVADFPDRVGSRSNRPRIVGPF